MIRKALFKSIAIGEREHSQLLMDLWWGFIIKEQGKAFGGWKII